MTRDEIRPFDKNRNGTLFSEGAGALVLESLDHAAARGASPLAELAGGGLNNNAFHMTAPAKEGAGSAAAMATALADAGLAPEDVDHVNTHGTGTKHNDVTETQAIKAVLGEHARRVPITAIKSMTGHLMGAAGSAEAIASVLTIRDGVIPPTIHFEEPDPECDLDLVANAARPYAARTVISNSAGIGGCNAAVVFRKAAGA
jgi:3-oxoacyl-(acyl-carrier-protein) synthase